MSKVYMHLLGNYASSYYRQRLPSRHVHVPGVEVTCESDLRHIDYDTFWLPLLINPQFLPVFENLRRQGKRLVWETDDDLWNIPNWNPAAQTYTWQAIETVSWTARTADDIVVTTPSLKETVARCAGIDPGKIHVCPNLLDLDDWPDTPKRQPGPLRILWTGSQHHDLDLQEIVEPLERLVEEYQEKIQVLFLGCWPSQMAQVVRINRTHLPCEVPLDKYNGHVNFINPVSLDEYPRALCSLRPDIALAPLCDDRFNDSKSGIKWYECALAGAAMVATDLPPYQEIRHGVDGLLVKCGDKNGWYETIKKLIDDAEWREGIASRGRSRVIGDFTWQHGEGKRQWEDFFRRLA